MHAPRHRQRAVRRRRLLQRSSTLAVLGVGVGLLLTLRRDGGGDRTLAATGADARPPAATSTTRTTSTGGAPITVTTTTAAPPAATEPAPSTWYAVVLSVARGGADPEALRQELTRLGHGGRVINTDDVRTGDGRAPDHLPAPGLLVGAIGPFDSREQAVAWCATHDGERGCQVRQLIPR